jgi:hypothetical protein
MNNKTIKKVPETKKRTRDAINNLCSTMPWIQLIKSQCQEQWLKLVILATWVVEIRRIAVIDQSGKKVVRPHLNRKNWARWHASVIPATVGSLK